MGAPLFVTRVISDKGLEELQVRCWSRCEKFLNFKQSFSFKQYYKYHGTDNSPLNKYIMQPFWGWLIQFFPLWIAPNTITLIGFVGMLIATAYAAWSNPTFHEELSLPSIVVAIIAVFVYQTLDALDGKVENPKLRLFGCFSTPCCNR
jgi:hypothetical protein